jgi:hypothetical protein
MKKPWRPSGWINPNKFNFEKAAAFEAGADAMIAALWKLAEASPTRTFCLDANTQQLYNLEG